LRIPASSDRGVVKGRHAVVQNGSGFRLEPIPDSKSHPIAHGIKVVKNHIGRLKAEIGDLEVKLAEKKADLESSEKQLAILSDAQSALREIGQ
jgi:hypothetical protein